MLICTYSRHFSAAQVLENNRVTAFRKKSRAMSSFRDGRSDVAYLSKTLLGNDSTVHAFRKRKIEIGYKLQSDADGTDNWSKRNKLHVSIHYGKSACTTLGSRQKYKQLSN